MVVSQAAICGPHCCCRRVSGKLNKASRIRVTTSDTENSGITKVAEMNDTNRLLDRGAADQ